MDTCAVRMDAAPVQRGARALCPSLAEEERNGGQHVCAEFSTPDIWSKAPILETYCLVLGSLLPWLMLYQYLQWLVLLGVPTDMLSGKSNRNSSQSKSTKGLKEMEEISVSSLIKIRKRYYKTRLSSLALALMLQPSWAGPDPGSPYRTWSLAPLAGRCPAPALALPVPREMPLVLCP